MPSFRYTALDATGREIAGVLDAASEQALLNELESRSLTPVSLAAKASAMDRGQRALPTRKLGLAYTQLADLLNAGVPILRGLHLLGRSKSRSRFTRVFRQVADNVGEGSDLADAMESTKGAFPRIHVAMVRAGEKGGFLEQVLGKLGAFVERQADFRAKVIGSLTYPAVLVVIGGSVMTAILGVFVPMFRELFESQPNLPSITELVFAASDVVTKYAFFAIIALAILAVGLWRGLKDYRVRRVIDIGLTKVYVLGPIVRSLAAARFCRMLGTMLGNGVPMLAAMTIAKDAAGNVLLEETIEDATEAVRAGDPLVGPLQKSGLFGDDVIEMIDVAENANNLDTMLVTIADTIEKRVDRLLNSAVKLVEPLLLVVIASCVVVVAAALLLPMVEMSGNV
ncbi:MAG: type II secretion system F family protein [Phycisphaeraceae bacterium]|nr:type II secretion system F family protein [Phycisphaerales bacterium]MCB9860314.1 type II secretion system F family protein [Phycisphaeraceae bacterium]